VPRFDKTCVTQFASTGCEKQLRFALHPDTIAYRGERQALNLLWGAETRIRVVSRRSVPSVDALRALADRPPPHPPARPLGR
jgi:uncharacterized protein (UPF0254 family)